EQERDAAEVARDGERKAKQGAEKARERLALLTYARSVDLAHREWADNHVTRARELLQSCPPGLPGWGGHHVRRLRDAALLALAGHRWPTSSASFSPDGPRLVTAGQDGEVRVWDARSGKGLLVLRGHRSEVVVAAFSPDGTRIVSSDTNGNVRVCDART